jgi:hypothetical protein
MANALLVNIDLDRGLEILRILDEAGLKISVALWVHLEQYADWQFLVSSRRLDTVSLRDGFRLINDALDAAGFTIEKVPPILILPMNDPSIRALRRMFSKSGSVEGMRVGGQQIGNRWVEDGYVYRIK